MARTLEKPKKPKLRESVGIRLPKHILPRYILSTEQPFLFEIPKDSLDEFYSFRWVNQPPKGMYFLYERKAINWVPTEKQLDAFQVSYVVRMKVDEIMESTRGTEDSSQVFKTLPVLESREENMWIYVNDPPRFLTKPTITEFTAGSTFRYEPIVQDKNKDSNIKFDLEVAPEGMTFENGVLKWETDSSHVEVYDVRLIATDGFERTAQEFKLYSRAGVKILSKAPQKASVGNDYNYAVKVWRQKPDEKINYKLFYGPEGMRIEPNGSVTWRPNPVQIDSIKYCIVVSHGVATDTQYVNIFVNHPPIIKSAPMIMNKINVGGIWTFDLEIKDPNKNDILTYTAHELPEGMRMDPQTGRLHWEPSMNELDFHSLKIEVSDRHESRMIEADFFVNAPVQIISIPSMAAVVGEQYSYKLMINDKNKGTLLPFKKVVKIEDVSAVRIYSINVADDVALSNIDRF